MTKAAITHVDQDFPTILRLLSALDLRSSLVNGFTAVSNQAVYGGVPPLSTDRHD